MTDTEIVLNRTSELADRFFSVVADLLRLVTFGEWMLLSLWLLVPIVIWSS